MNNSQKCATELTGKTRAFAHGLWPQRKCCRLIKTRVYTTKCRISNMEQVVPKLCTRNLNIQQITWRTQDYLFAGKLKIDKLKIKYCSMLAARGAARGSRRGSRLAAQRCITCKCNYCNTGQTSQSRLWRPFFIQFGPIRQNNIKNKKGINIEGV